MDDRFNFFMSTISEMAQQGIDTSQEDVTTPITTTDNVTNEAPLEDGDASLINIEKEIQYQEQLKEDALTNQQQEDDLINQQQEDDLISQQQEDDLISQENSTSLESYSTSSESYSNPFLEDEDEDDESIPLPEDYVEQIKNEIAFTSEDLNEGSEMEENESIGTVSTSDTNVDNLCGCNDTRDTGFDESRKDDEGCEREGEGEGETKYYNTDEPESPIGQENGLEHIEQDDGLEPIQDITEHIEQENRLEPIQDITEPIQHTTETPNSYEDISKHIKDDIDNVDDDIGISSFDDDLIGHQIKPPEEIVEEEKQKVDENVSIEDILFAEEERINQVNLINLEEMSKNTEEEQLNPLLDLDRKSLINEMLAKGITCNGVSRDKSVFDFGYAGENSPILLEEDTFEELQQPEEKEEPKKSWGITSLFKLKK